MLVLQDTLLSPSSFSAAIEPLDIPRILSQQGGEAAYPLPRIKTLEVHSKLNLAALLFIVKCAHFHNSHLLQMSKSAYFEDYVSLIEYGRWRQCEE